MIGQDCKAYSRRVLVEVAGARHDPLVDGKTIRVVMTLPADRLAA